MLLNELFTQPVDYTIDRNSAHHVSGKFEIDGNTYVMEAFRGDIEEVSDTYKIEGLLPSHIDSIWEIEFMIAQYKGKTRTLIATTTGTGNAATVFATMIQFIRDVVQEHNAHALLIEATKEEQSRVKLYERMTTMLANKFGWKTTTVQGTNAYAFLVYQDQQ